MKRVRLIFISLLLVGALLRLYKLTDYPVSLYWDEVAQGYSAYSISETGKDEYGNQFPLFFRSYEDYKLPGYIYSTSIFTKLFGLSEWTTRLPSALFGVLSIAVFYFIVQSLLTFKDFKHISSTTKKQISLLSALFLAVSPWHIQFSRGAFEANAGLCIVLIAILFTLKSYKNNNTLFLSAFFYALSLYFYRSMFVFVPFIISGFCALFFHEIRDYPKKTVISSFLLFLSFSIPLVVGISQPLPAMRASQVNLANNLEVELAESARRIQASGNGIYERIRYNRRLIYMNAIIKQVADHVNGKFLFQTGDNNLRHSLGTMGLMYYFDGIFIIFGLFLLLKKHLRIGVFIFIWYLVGIIPAALTVPTPHALRSLNSLPALIILSAFGIVALYSYMKNKLRYIFITIISVVFMISVSQYLRVYYTTYQKASAGDWADGYEQLVRYVQDQNSAYETVIVTGHYWKPHMYFLFYENFDPKTYQAQGSELGFDKYIFGKTGWGIGEDELDQVDLYSLTSSKNTLVVLSPSEYNSQQSHINYVTKIYNRNNSVEFIIGELK